MTPPYFPVHHTVPVIGDRKPVRRGGHGDSVGADDPPVEINLCDLVGKLQRDPHASVSVERDPVRTETRRQREEPHTTPRGDPNKPRLVLLGDPNVTVRAKDQLMCAASSTACP